MEDLPKTELSTPPVLGLGNLQRSCQMNKQEALKALDESSWEYENRYFRYELAVNLEDAKETISQIEEPQKVVIPKFVAEWIDELKKSHSNLAWVWQVYPNEPKVKNWLESNTEKFMRAWLDGYKEEEDETE